MRLSRPFHRRPGWVIALGTLVAAVYGLSMLWDAVEPACTTVVLDRLSSPDGAWFAVNEAFTCDVVSSDIGGGISLVTTEPPFRSMAMLVVDTGGYADQQRPHIAWPAPNVLRVTVPLHALLHIPTGKTDGVRLDIHFDPDDPAARADWLQQTDRLPNPADGTKPQ
jgi:hypothetical protein